MTSCIKDIESAFDSKTSAKKYHEELKQTFRIKLTTPVYHVYNIHIHSWEMRLKVTNDRLNIEGLDRR